ncbi:MAG: tetratricopeptide repeat protein [Planctomycetota bacterium]
MKTRARLTTSATCLIVLLLAACREDPESTEPKSPPQARSETAPAPQDEVDLEGEQDLWVQRYLRRRNPQLMERVDELTRRVESSPNEATALVELGWIEYQIGRQREAVLHLQKATQISRRNPEAAYRLGVVLLNQQDLEEAEKHLRRAVEIAPDHHLARQQLAVACLRLQREEEARQHFERAVRENPHDAESRVYLARLLVEDDQERAIRMLEEATTVNRFHRGAYDLLRRLYRRAGRLEDAKQAMSLVEDLAVLDDLGVLETPLEPVRFLAEADYYRRHGLLQRARQVIEEGQRVHPSETDIRLLAGRIAVQTSRWSDATQALAKASELSPDDIEVFEQGIDWIRQLPADVEVPGDLTGQIDAALARWPELAEQWPLRAEGDE